MTDVAVLKWLGHGRAGPATGYPRRWALPCHFPDCAHNRVLLPESFRGGCSFSGPCVTGADISNGIRVALPSNVSSNIRAIAVHLLVQAHDNS